MQERQVLICHNPHRITFAKTDMIKWSKEAKKEGENKKRLSLFSLYFPAVPSCFEVWQTLPTFAGRNVQ